MSHQLTSLSEHFGESDLQRETNQGQEEKMAGVENGSVSHSLCSSCFLPQDTVVALQALAIFATLTAANHDVTVKVNRNAITTVATFHIHPDNQMLQQNQQVNKQSGGGLVAVLRMASGF